MLEEEVVEENIHQVMQVKLVPVVEVVPVVMGLQVVLVVLKVRTLDLPVAVAILAIPETQAIGMQTLAIQNLLHKQGNWEVGQVMDCKEISEI